MRSLYLTPTLIKLAYVIQIQKNIMFYVLYFAFSITFSQFNITQGPMPHYKFKKSGKTNIPTTQQSNTQRDLCRVYLKKLLQYPSILCLINRPL